MSFFGYFKRYKENTSSEKMDKNALQKAINKKENSQPITKETSPEFYNSYLQGCFHSYLVNQATYFSKFMGKVSVDQVEINRNVNQTFAQYISYIRDNQNNARELLSLTQQSRNYFTNNVLTNPNVNQDEFLGDCKVISTVYEALLAKQAVSPTGMLTSAEANGIGRNNNLADKFLNDEKYFFDGAHFYRGDEDFGATSIAVVGRLTQQDDASVANALRTIVGATNDFEQTIQKDYDDFQMVASASQQNEQ